MSISENLGFIVGPALAGILSVTKYGDIAPVLGAIVISLIGTLLIIFYVPESKECTLEESEEAGNIRKLFGYEIRECGITKGIKKPDFRKALRFQIYPICCACIF